MTGRHTILACVLLLGSALAGGAVATAGRQAAELLPGTYYVDLYQVLDGSPEFAEAATAAMAPLKARGDEISAEEKELEDAISQLQLMKQESLEYAQKRAQLQIKEQALNEEKKALVQLRDTVREKVMADATMRVHKAAEQVGMAKGYEAVILSPLPLSELQGKSPGVAMELLRQRSTLWVHPSRDITAEVVAAMSAN